MPKARALPGERSPCRLQRCGKLLALAFMGSGQRLRVVARCRAQQPRQADRLLAERRACAVLGDVGRVALVEQQVNHGQHRAEALGQLRSRRHQVRDALVADPGLGADDPLGDRRGRRQERAGDLLGRKATQSIPEDSVLQWRMFE